MPHGPGAGDPPQPGLGPKPNPEGPGAPAPNGEGPGAKPSAGEGANAAPPALGPGGAAKGDAILAGAGAASCKKDASAGQPAPRTLAPPLFTTPAISGEPTAAAAEAAPEPPGKTGAGALGLTATGPGLGAAPEAPAPPDGMGGVSSSRGKACAAFSAAISLSISSWVTKGTHPSLYLNQMQPRDLQFSSSLPYRHWPNVRSFLLSTLIVEFVLKPIRNSKV
mmetsp:Transcript_104731/g.265956  ORF Transcript_104731/g.265956 Transcript_104731/m.265956 type:complete len:222 (+) Transcript_104731:735-1400(+)